MTSDMSLPPHLEEIGRQLTSAAPGLNASERPGRHIPAMAARPPIALATACAVALAAAGAVLLFGLARPGKALRPQPPAVNIARQQSHSHLAPLVNPTAAKVLRRAAYVALQTSPATPAADQFVYTRTEDGSGQITQSWMSVDGTHTSLIDQPGNSTPMRIQGCVDGHISGREPGKDGKPLSDFLPKSDAPKPLTLEAVKRYFGGQIPMDGPTVRSRCTPQPAFFPDMPTSPQGMQAYLVRTQVAYATGVTSPSVALNNLAKNVGYMLDTDYLLPAQQAALYEFLATTPGITLERDVKDVAGRPGIGIRWSFEGSSAMLIFDPTTYQYLGASTTGIDGPTSGEALLRSAIVATAGQPPAAVQQPSGSQNPA